MATVNYIHSSAELIHNNCCQQNTPQQSNNMPYLSLQQMTQLVIWGWSGNGTSSYWYENGTSSCWYEKERQVAIYLSRAFSMASVWTVYSNTPHAGHSSKLARESGEREGKEMWKVA